MGLFLSRVLDAISGTTEKRILMVGLDAAGKTTVLYRLHLGETMHTIPTVGFNVEHVQYKNIDFTVWDIGGQFKLRKLWRHYFHGTDAIIFVVDAADRNRLDEAKTELHLLLGEDLLSNCILLVYCNKIDMPGAMTAAEMVQLLELDKMGGRHRQWYVQTSCATSGEGLYEGLDWLSKALKSQPKPHQRGYHLSI